MKLNAKQVLKTSFFISLLIQISLCSLFLFGTLIGGEEKYGPYYQDTAIYTAFLSLQYFPIIFGGVLVLVVAFYLIKARFLSGK